MKVRKIESKEKEEQRRKKNQRTLGIIMILILTGGIFGIIVSNFGNSDNNFYGKRVLIDNREFVENQGFWLTENPLKNNKYLYFVYLPNQTQENIKNISDIDIDYSGKTIYIDSESQDILASIYRNFYDIALRIQPGCVNPEDCEKDAPLKDCDDNIIIISDKNQSSIIQKENCIYINSNTENLLKTTEEFIYRYYDIK